MKKSIIILTMILITLISVQAVGYMGYTILQPFPDQMVAGSTYTAQYRLKNNVNEDIPVFFTFNISRSIPFDWSEFSLSGEIDGLALNCTQISLGDWECWNNTDFYVFPRKTEKDLTLNLSLHIRAEPSDLDYVLQVIGHEITVKPAESEKILASAFDFSTDSIVKLDDINAIDYLEYGRANAYVRKIYLTPFLGSYEGTLKFYASGMEDHYPFSVALYSLGPLDCTNFNEVKMTCTAYDGTMRIRRRVGFSYINDLKNICEFVFEADSDPAIKGGRLTVKAYVQGATGCDVEVLNAETEEWDYRVPQQPITFKSWKQSLP